MRVQCYAEGSASVTDEYADTPSNAAELFVAEWIDDNDRGPNIVVTPIDDEARALPGWRSDAEEPAYMLFLVRATVEWKAEPVERFG